MAHPVANRVRYELNYYCADVVAIHKETRTPAHGRRGGSNVECLDVTPMYSSVFVKAANLLMGDSFNEPDVTSLKLNHFWLAA